MKEKKTVIGLLLGAIVLMAVGYAAFTTNLVINGTANISSTWKVLFTDIDIVSKSDGVTEKSTPTASGTTATFDVGLTSPGDSIEYIITVANQGTIDAIIDDITASETGSDAIKFEITDIKIGDSLLAQASTTFKVKISYDDSITSQPSVLNNTLTVDINYVQNVGQAITPSDPVIDSSSTVTLANKLQSSIATAQSDSSIDFSKTSAEDGTKGLYYTSANTEGNETVYYYRGAVDNNYVKFGTQTRNTCRYNGIDVIYFPDTGTLNDSTYEVSETECTSTNVCQIDGLGLATGLNESRCQGYGGTLLTEKAIYTKDATEDILWRIVRINEDSSVRLVTEKIIGGSAFTSHIDDNAYVGYMYGTAGSSTYALTHENKSDSTIKGYLDDWYTLYLSNYFELLSIDAGFCNDRSINDTAGKWNSDDTALGYGTNYTLYGGYNRLFNNKKPQFICPNSDNDLFTTTTSNKGNKKLINPIGLLTADEVIYAGGDNGEYMGGEGENYYLDNGTAWWTMTPQIYNSSGGVYMEPISSYGIVYVGTSDVGIGVRPVINIKSNVIVTKGTGISTDPYVIKTS